MHYSDSKVTGLLPHLMPPYPLPLDFIHNLCSHMLQPEWHHIATFGDKEEICPWQSGGVNSGIWLPELSISEVFKFSVSYFPPQGNEDERLLYGTVMIINTYKGLGLGFATKAYLSFYYLLELIMDINFTNHLKFLKKPLFF